MTEAIAIAVFAVVCVTAFVLAFKGGTWAVHRYWGWRCRHGHEYLDSRTGYITKDFCWRGHGRLPKDQWATPDQTSALHDVWGGFVS